MIRQADTYQLFADAAEHGAGPLWTQMSAMARAGSPPSAARTWTWHDRGHAGDRPMVWLDGSLLRRPSPEVATKLDASDAPFASGFGRRRSTASYVYYVSGGTGSTHIGEATAYLFRFDDRPMVESLGCYRDASLG